MSVIQLEKTLNKMAYFVKTALTMGNLPQSFIGARWIPLAMKLCPNSKKRWLALRVLLLSPHYFFRNINSEYAKLSYDRFLEAEYARNQNSRKIIYELILKPYLKENDVVLDVGCGPGFLAKVVSNNVKKVYAIDISSGVLACAKVINASVNIEYMLADGTHLNHISDNSLDVIFSFAAVQHITNEVFQTILENCFTKLNPDGKVIFQVQLEDPKWRSEEDWRVDSSLIGHIRFRYAMHCFSRTSSYFNNVLPKFGFQVLSLDPIKNLVEEKFDDIWSQHLLIAKKLAVCPPRCSQDQQVGQKRSVA